MNRRDQFRRHVAIALVAAAIILLQIGLTRVLSVLLWYHWAFFSISLSMLGVGAPGVWFAIRQPGPKTLTISLLSAGLLIPLGMFLVMGHSVVFGDMAVVYCMLALLPAVLSLGSGYACCYWMQKRTPLVLDMPTTCWVHAWERWWSCC